MSRAPRQSSNKGEALAAAIVLLLGVPAIFLFARAMADGEAHRRDAPLQALIGKGVFEQLKRGDKTPAHYYGAELSAPDFSLRDRHGAPWRLSDQRGKLVVMNFWTITCQPCVEEMPSLQELATLAERRPDLEVVAVTTDKSWAEVATIFPANSKLKVLFDPDKKVVSEKFGTKLFPETWVIDKQGIVRLRVDGARDWAAPLTLDALARFL